MKKSVLAFAIVLTLLQFGDVARVRQVNPSNVTTIQKDRLFVFLVKVRQVVDN